MKYKWFSRLDHRGPQKIHKEYSSKLQYFNKKTRNKEWEEAMMEEYQSIMKNDVWDIVPKQENKSAVSSKWIYKIKQVVLPIGPSGTTKDT